MNYSVFDVETDGLIETVTKIHCMCARQYKDGVITDYTFIEYEDMINFLQNETVLVGHKIITFDIPVCELLLGIKIKARLVDTLGLSWYLYPHLHVHGLEEWGEQFEIPKPEIKDWNNLDVEDYIHRCSTDVEINVRLFDKQKEYLTLIYGDMNKANRLIGYLTFKLECAREMEEVKWKLDIDKCKSGLQFLLREAQKKIDILESVMPSIVKYKTVSRPKELYKKDKTLSVAGAKWLELLKEQGLPEYHVGAIKVPTNIEKPKATSHSQIKNWLIDQGWIPITFKYEKTKDGLGIRKIPQLSHESEICPSVKKLYSKIPELIALEGLFVLQHRIGILNGFLENVDSEGYVKAQIKGFTNTLRFQHSVIVNLPTVGKPYGEIVRGCLICPEGYILCGSDMSGLEDKTKRHYMYYFDPEYVKEMERPDFDPHLDIGLEAGMVTIDDVNFFKEFKKEIDDKERFGTIKETRIQCKRVNFSSTYGAGPAKIALTGGFPLKRAKILHAAYWKRNWAIKKVAAMVTVKTIGKQMWLLNPVSQLWYSLRNEKDKFSTLNQGTGVYCFDTWVRKIRRQCIKLCGQFHDEIISPIPSDDKQIMTQVLNTAIKDTNDELQLNVQLGISIDFGLDYASIH